MSHIIAKLTALALPALLITTACDRAAKSDGAEPFDVAIDTFETVISLESELIAQPTGITVAEDGRVWLVDAQMRRVLSVAPDGSDPRFFGKEGSGPGEFRRPAAIAVAGGRVRVFDLPNIQDYTTDGTPVSDRAVAAPWLGAGAIDAHGKLVAPTMGRDSALAVVHSLNDSASVRLGPIVVPPPATGARAEFFRRNAEIRNELTRMYPLLTMIGGAEVDGRLWVMMVSPAGTPKAIYVLAANGDVVGRIRLALPAQPGVFAIDGARKRMYVSLPEEAALLAIDLSGVPVW